MLVGDVMLKTIIAVIKVVTFMVGKTFALYKAQCLTRKNLISERDVLVQDTVRQWARYVLDTVGAKVQVSGQQNMPENKPCVFISNHQSNMDIPLLFAYIKHNKAFVAKAELKRVPILASWMKMLQCTFIKRRDIKASIQAMNEAVEKVKRGYSLVIFPEGTRSKGKAPHAFKAGSFKLAFSANVPIVPVTINGTWHLLEEKGMVRAATVTLIIHPAIETVGLDREKQHEVVKRVEKTIMQAIPEYTENQSKQ